MHVSKKGRGSSSRKMHIAISEDMKYMQSYGIKDPCVQIFVAGPKGYKETLTQDEKTQIAKYIREHKTKLVIHGAYVDRPWGGLHAAIENVVRELHCAREIGATGVILHLSAACADDVQMSRALNALVIDNSPIIWLEIHAAKPSAFTYETPQKLRSLFSRIRGYAIKGLRIGLCIDTAHLFACGTNLDTYESAKQWITSVTTVLQEESVDEPIPVMMHLNDSESKLASGVDKHAPICFGNIWKQYHPTTGHLPFESSGLAYLLQWAQDNNIHTILEQDDDVLHKDLTLIQKLGYFQ